MKAGEWGWMKVKKHPISPLQSTFSLQKKISVRLGGLVARLGLIAVAAFHCFFARTRRLYLTWYHL